LSSADILHTRGEGGILQMWTSALFGAKIIGFFEIYGVSAQTSEEGVELVPFENQRVWISKIIFC